MCICVIPARGGSKRIPRKNIRPFHGRPMIAWAIETALRSGRFQQVIVSTEALEIAEVARQWGALVPFLRPAKLADDHATTDDVLVHALETLTGQGFRPEYACCLYATAVFTTADDLNGGFEQLRQTGATAAIPVTSFDFPIWRSVRVNDAGFLEFVWPEHRYSRSQDLPEVLHDTGQFYWVRVKEYLKERAVFSSRCIPLRIPRSRVVDIDTEEDWLEALERFQPPEEA